MQKIKDNVYQLKRAMQFSSICFLIVLVFIQTAGAKQNVKQSQGTPAETAKKDNVPIYMNTKYSFRERAADLVSRMTLEEEVRQLHTNFAPAIPRLGVHQYFYWSEGQHGINAMFGNIHNGSHKKQRFAYGAPHATSFPVNFATTMSWDP